MGSDWLISADGLHVFAMRQLIGHLLLQHGFDIAGYRVSGKQRVLHDHRPTYRYLR